MSMYFSRSSKEFLLILKKIFFIIVMFARNLVNITPSLRIVIL